MRSGPTKHASESSISQSCRPVLHIVSLVFCISLGLNELSHWPKRRYHHRGEQAKGNVELRSVVKAKATSMPHLPSRELRLVKWQVLVVWQLTAILAIKKIIAHIIVAIQIWLDRGDKTTA